MRAKRQPLHVLLVFYAVLGLAYAWATPPFEASDELWHFGMVETLRETRTLPVQDPNNRETLYRQEGSQPPLYYILSALLIAPFDLSDADSLRVYNPHAKVGIPAAEDNKNIVLHDTPHPPLEKTVLAVYTLRLFSLLLGGVTVWAVYETTRTLFPHHPALALVAAGVTAFNPMFLFIAASVNNDNLVTALNSVVLLLFVRTLRAGFDTRRSLLLAFLLALATLSKLSGLVLVPVIVAGAFWLLAMHRDVRGFLTLGVAMAVLWAGLAGWWYARNLTLYGELFGTAMMVAVAGARPEPASLATLLREFEGFRIAYWGLFGTVNVLTFAWFYSVMDILTVLAVIGMLWELRYAWRHERYTLFVPMTLLLALLLLGFVSVAAWTAQTYASQGRLLFPFAAATGTLLAWGWLALTRGRGGRIFVGALGTFALVVPFASIAPRYAAPQPLAALPDSAQPVYARYGDFVELVGYDTPDTRYAPSDQLPVTLYWRVLRQTDRDYSLYVHLLDDEGQVAGRVDTFPLGGRLRTSAWQTGVLYADRYVIPFDELRTGRENRFALRLQVHWWDYAARKSVPIADADGAPLEAVVLRGGALVDPVSAPNFSDIPRLEPVRFGDSIRLIGALRQEDALTLLWETVATPNDSLTVFAQVLDEGGALVGQGDAPPTLPTRYWRTGERYVTRHTLAYPNALAAGAYRLIVGWYHPETFARLATASGDGTYTLEILRVE